jgi:hypothetical protein
MLRWSMVFSRWTVVACLLAACGDDGGANALPDAPALDDAQQADATRDGATCTPTSPTTEICDDLDNDCDGLVDNVDSGGDGLYDCQRVLLLGSPGVNPSSNFQTWAFMNGTVVSRQTNPTIDADLLAMYDLVLIDRVPRTYTADEANALATWVAAGNGVMALTGYAGSGEDSANPNSLLVALGASFENTLLSGPVTTFPTHPTNTGLTSVTFSGGRPVTTTASNVTVVGTIGTTNVAVAFEHGEGRAYLWGDEWVTFDSQWSSMPEIKLFWVNAFGWLGKFQ